MKVRGVRGAIVVGDDSRDEVLGATARLVQEIIERNQVDPQEIVSVFFTSTEDLRSAFPAEAARQIGLSHVPLLGAREVAVDGAMSRVVRVLMHFNTEASQSEIDHVYLGGAESLRDDL
ncbi:MAG: chorismate mutase [Actinomycetota bacterium]